MWCNTDLWMQGRVFRHRACAQMSAVTGYKIEEARAITQLLTPIIDAN